MTVAELIKELKAMPKNMTVATIDTVYGVCDVDTVYVDEDEYDFPKGKKTIKKVIIDARYIYSPY